jgi:2,4-dienoyl-CoA reductase-like NADH-dependent reductase (Old Yellow Enzyme family)
MALDLSPLFETLNVQGRKFRNRVVMPPMVVNRDITRSDGVRWYARRAEGGVGLVIVEATAVNRFGSELTAASLRPLVQSVHDAGALIAIQLFPVTRGRSVTPADVGPDELESIAENYRTAAGICAAAGFDGVEPHGAHGYLLNQFFSPVQNTRTDQYGGALENRMRMALRVVRICRTALGNDHLLLYRHTPVGQGYGIEESLELARALIAAGVDLLDLSPSSHSAPGDRAAPFAGLGVPVIAVGELDIVSRALEVLNEDRADLVAIGRGLIADPDWPQKVAEGRLDEIVRCVQCDGCHRDLRQGVEVECRQWEPV